MPFAYLTHSGATLHKQGRRLVLTAGAQDLTSFGLAHLESVIIRGNLQLTASARTALLRAGVQTTFLSAGGRLLGQLVPPQSGHVELRLTQYRLLNDEPRRFQWAKSLVGDKLLAMLEVLTRYSDNYSDSVVRDTRRQLQGSATRLETISSRGQLLGLEGNAGAAYWGAYARMNRSSLRFRGRSRRPPRDEINALLSLGYVILGNELRTLVEAAGMDPFLGFYHDLKNHRPSLALDLIEPYRHELIDRVVLRLANLGRIRPGHFRESSEGAFQLDVDGWKVFLREYEERLLSPPSGPLQDRYPQARTWRELLWKNCLAVRRRLLELSTDPPPGSESTESV